MFFLGCPLQSVIKVQQRKRAFKADSTSNLRSVHLRGVLPPAVPSHSTPLCRVTCPSLNSYRPDGGQDLRSHDDHGVLPPEQNQKDPGPPRGAGTGLEMLVHLTPWLQS